MVEVEDRPLAELTETLDRIEALQQWGAGWNDYHGSPPNAVRIARAIAWVKDMYRDASATNEPWSTPLVTASEDGEILFEWWRDPKRLSVYITELGAEYIKAWGPHILNEMEEGPADTSKIRRGLWQWLAD